MSNICDYIKWRGDLTFKQSEFNDLDNLIISRFSYFPFDNIIEENEIVTIRELAERFAKEDVNKLPILWPDDVELFPLMGKSKRFGELKATKYINHFDKDQDKQFAAITVFLPDNTIFVSFRGTDSSFVGWKEDFNMSFKSHVSSQIDAVNYLEEVAKKYHGRIKIGGHSKGGNIAIYSAIFANKKIKKRIIDIYNYDGPGFMDDITETKEYKKIINKVHTFIPQDSIIGRLLNHEEKCTVVKSIEKGIMQHDIYSWLVEGKEFDILDGVTTGSIFIDKTITEWLANTEPEKREQVLDTVFEIIASTDAETTKQFKANWLSNAKTMISRYGSVDKETKKVINEMANALLKATKDTMLKKN